MKIVPIDSFDSLTEKECIKIQEELACNVQPFNTDYSNNVKTIAGVDLAYWKDGEERAVCCIVVFDVQRKTILEKVHSTDIVMFPYIPGCLAFRELPLVVAASQKLTIQPDLYMFDGNGVLHPRHMGLATHASFYLNRPTVGVAKSYYKIKDTEFVMPENEAGCFTNIVIDHKVCGRTVRTHKNVKPIFVSVGNYIDIDTATSLSLSLVQHDSHIPMPTRYADLETHLMREVLRHPVTDNL